MAEVKEPKEEVKAPKAAATKTVFLQRAAETEQQFEFVCINGKAYQVPRGKPVEVPLAVAEVLEHAQMQEAELFERVSAMQKQ